MNNSNIKNYTFSCCSLAINQLFDDVKNQKKTDVFTSTYVVVPSRQYASYLKYYYLKNNNDVLMNVEFITFIDLIKKIAVIDKGFVFADDLEISSLILKYLKETDISSVEEIKSYILNDDDNYNFISPTTYDLVNTLSSLFKKYDEDLFEINDNHYQKDIYDYVLKNLLNKRHYTLKMVLNDSHLTFKINNPIFFFGFINENKLIEKFISLYSNKHEIYLYHLLVKDIDELKENKLTYVASPSKLKEVEYVHSSICKLLYENKDLRYSDFLVVVNNFNDYIAEIKRTFDQDDIEFPRLKYNISSFSKVDSDLSLLFSLLFEIKNKGYYSRLDFFTFLSNPLIKNSQNIDDDFIDNIQNLLVNNNIYRESETNKDFEYIKKRLLLSYFYDYEGLRSQVYKIDDKDYIPLSFMGSSSTFVNTFVNIINFLDSFLNLFKEDNLLTSEKMNQFKALIENMISLDDNECKEYRKILDIFYYFSLYNLFEDGLNNISFDVLFYYLLDLSKTNKSASGVLFDGISFIEFNDDYIIPNKYVFFLGFNASNYPKKDIKSELDLRNDIIDIAKIESDIFNLYYLSSSYVYVSYQCVDLLTSEELFVSNILLPYLNHFSINKPLKIDIDETRSWKELFTRNEYKNKNYYLTLLSLKDEDVNQDESSIEEIKNKKIKLSSFCDYLNNPFEMKVNRLFHVEEDINASMKEEFEPFYQDNLNKYNAFSYVVDYMLENKVISIDDIDLDELLNKLLLTNSFPSMNEDIIKSAMIDIKNEVINYFKMISRFCVNEYELIDGIRVNVNIDGELINIYSDSRFIRYISDTGERYYFVKKYNKNKRKYSSFISNYMFSLVDILSIDDNDLYKIYKINLIRGYDKDEDKDEIINHFSFSLSKADALKVITNIYKDLFNYSSLRYVPIDILSINESKLETYDKYYNSLSSYSSYFPFFSLFGKYDLGFHDDKFKQEIDEEINKRKELLLFINVDAEKKENGQV
ncbi:MAG: hypothetical protein ACI31G_05275 [Bacilli bacterium]